MTTIRQHRYLMVVMVLLAALWEFEPVRNAGFIYQDNRWQAADEATTNAVPPLTAKRSLMRWSWWAQARFTPSPLAFHSVNLALHLMVSLLVVALANNIGLPPPGSWVAGLVFLLNPAQMETVAYISGRTELFAAIGVLVACNIAASNPPWWAWNLVIASIAFGLLGKESAIAAVVLVPAVRRQWGLTALATLVMVAVVEFEAHRQGFYLINPYDTIRWTTAQAAAGWLLLCSSFTLTDLTVDRNFSTLTPAVQAMSAYLLTSSLVTGWVYRRVYPILAISAVWVVAVVIPRMIVFTEHGSEFNDHQFYLGRVGVALAIAFLFTRFNRMRVTV